MARDLETLEDLVTKAVERLAVLREERDRLDGELQRLRAERAAKPPAVTRPDERAAWARVLRETLAELRGD
jgi:hypothetical protein